MRDEKMLPPNRTCDQIDSRCAKSHGNTDTAAYNSKMEMMGEGRCGGFGCGN